MRWEYNIITPTLSFNKSVIPLPLINNKHHLLRYGVDRYFLNHFMWLFFRFECQKYLSFYPLRIGRRHELRFVFPFKL